MTLQIFLPSTSIQAYNCQYSVSFSSLTSLKFVFQLSPAYFSGLTSVLSVYLFSPFEVSSRLSHLEFSSLHSMSSLFSSPLNSCPPSLHEFLIPLRPSPLFSLSSCPLVTYSPFSFKILSNFSSLSSLFPLSRYHSSNTCFQV